MNVLIFKLANSADPDEMLLYAAFHLCLHCLTSYLFTGIQNEKWFTNKTANIGIFPIKDC